MNTAVHTESLRCVQDARHFSNPILRSTSFRFRGVIEISCLWHEVEIARLSFIRRNMSFH